METLYHNFIGPFILLSLIFSILLAYILPKTILSKYFKIGQTYFLITNICGIIVSAIGIIAIFLFTPEIVKSYLWKILIMPYVYLQIYMLYVINAKKTTKIFDEKQDFNMTTGAAISFGAMIIVMAFIIKPLITDQILEINLLNPFFINASILIYSITTLFLFKKA